MEIITTIINIVHSITTVIPVYTDGGPPEWILATNFWADSGAWSDSDVWND